jgi:hypothetical protein
MGYYPVSIRIGFSSGLVFRRIGFSPGLVFHPDWEFHAGLDPCGWRTPRPGVPTEIIFSRPEIEYGLEIIFFRPESENGLDIEYD